MICNLFQVGVEAAGRGQHKAAVIPEQDRAKYWSAAWGLVVVTLGIRFLSALYQ